MVKIAHKPIGNKTHVQHILGLLSLYSISLIMIIQIGITYPLTVANNTIHNQKEHM
jgi:hypothetical protein